MRTLEEKIDRKRLELEYKSYRDFLTYGEVSFGAVVKALPLSFVSASGLFMLIPIKSNDDLYAVSVGASILAIFYFITFTMSFIVNKRNVGRKIKDGKRKIVPVSQRDCDRLNRTMRLNSGETYRIYQFINTELSREHCIVIDTPTNAKEIENIDKDMNVSKYLGVKEITNLIEPIRRANKEQENQINLENMDKFR